MYFSLAMGSTECVLLSLMADDWYLAICNPQRCPLIMNKRVCVQIAAGCWVTGCLIVLQLSLCDHSIISHFTCEILAGLKLAWLDTSVVQLIMLVISVLLLPMPMLLICISFSFLFSNIVTISSVDCLSETFSICAAHLIVVVLFYGAALCMNLKPLAVNSQETVLDADGL
ncbi:olfactory receptor 13F1-like [Callospermophilus lateralis]